MERNCRFCKAPVTETFADLRSSPLANSYIKAGEFHKMEPFYPLHTFVCTKCLLVQLEEFESPSAIFGDYAYFSSYSDSWLKHAEKYVDMAASRFKLGEKSLAVEIASNDGYLLQYFKKYNVPVLGVEPAANVAVVAKEKGIPSRVEFFGTQTAQKMVSEGIKADLLIGNNVLAHVPNLNDFVGGMKVLLSPKGTITMEFPHLLKLIEESQFDTIYHEHFSYFSLITVEQVFAAHGLTLFDVEQLPTHGGSLRIFVRHTEDSERAVTANVTNLRKTEEDAGLRNIETYRKFADKVRAVKRDVLSFLTKAKEDGCSIVAYGAPAKGNTLLNYCGVGTDLIDYTLDRNPHKQNTLLPGSRIPVKAPDAIRETKPDYLFILPWNLKDEIVQQMSFVREWGCKFVVPIPRIEIF